MKLENLRIADLTPDPQNARQHDDKNLKAIMGSLREFGQRKPIVITEAGTIVAGNGTVEAAKRLGWLDIAVVKVPSDWTDAQVKAFALADNRTAELAAWNPEVLSAQIKELNESDFAVSEIGFEALDFPTEKEWENLFDATSSQRKEVGQMAFTLHNDQQKTIQEALAKSISMGDFGDTGNTNTNGNALARIVELWLGQQV